MDETGFRKKGRHWVGVTRQYCGQIGKQDNCQVAVSVSLATPAASVPIASNAPSPHGRSPPAVGRGTGTGAASARLPDRVMAGRQQRTVVRALCCLARACRARGSFAPRRVAADRMPQNQDKPTRYFLSNLPASTRRKELVSTVKARWRIERDYQDLKQEFGLDHYQGRGWRGFHHHATLCIAAHSFLVAQRLGGRIKKNRPNAGNLPCPRMTARGGRPTRAQRHVVDSIAPLRWTIAVEKSRKAAWKDVSAPSDLMTRRNCAGRRAQGLGMPRTNANVETR